MVDTELTVRVAASGAGKAAKDVAAIQDAIAKVAKETKDAKAVAEQMGKAFNLPADEVEDLARALKQVGAETQKATNEAKGLGNVFQGIFQGVGQQAAQVAIQAVQQLGQAIKGTVGEALNQSAAFDEARAAASTLTDDTDGLIAALEQAQGRLGNQVSTTELLAASYDILSSGFTEAADAAAIAEAAARGALAGFSDTNTTADALTTIINSYSQMGTTAADAEKIIDQLVKTQDLGKITLGQYADQVGRAASIAATAGVSFEEFSAAVATATAKGVPAEGAIGGTRQAIVNLLKPTADATALLKKYGIENSAAALRSEGLVGVLETLRDQGATTDELSKIFSDVDALATVATLAGENLGTFQANIEGIAGSTGATDKNLKLLTETINGQKRALVVLREEGFLALGQAIDPIRAGILTFANDLINATVEGSDGLGALSEAAERFRVVLSENPEIAERLGEALATIADAGVQQIALLVDAITALVGEQENIELIASNFEDLADVVTLLGQAARFVVALTDSLIGLQQTAESIPVLGDVINFNPASPIANVQQLIGTFETLRSVVGSAADFVANLLSRFDGLAQNPVIKALAGQILGVEEATAATASTVERATSSVGESLSGKFAASTQAFREKVNEIGEGMAGVGDSAQDAGDRTDAAAETIEDALKRLGDANKTALNDLSTDAANARAAILEAGGDPAKLATLEAKTLRDRIQNNRDFLKELEALQSRGGLSAEDAAAVADQIAQVDQQLAQDRVAIAKATVDAQKAAEAERVKAAQEAAKKTTDALKAQRDEEKRLADQAQADADKAAQREFDDARDGRAEARDDRRRAEDRAFQDALQADDDTHQKKVRAEDKAAQEERQAKEEAFQKAQDAKAEAFQARQQAERDRGNREFDALGSEVDRRFQLETADPSDRAALKEQFEEERKNLELRRQIEKEVLAQRGALLAQEDLSLSPLEQARADFEARLQEEAAAFQAAQQEEAAAFQAGLDDAEDARMLAREQAEDDRAKERRDLEDERDRLRREQDKEFEAEERRIQDEFEANQQRIKGEFNNEQRRLDKENAQAIAAILKSAEAPAIAGARANGGPVQAGQTYLVGEKGPELITPSRSGYVHTAAQTAAMLSGAPVRGAAVTVAQPSTGAVEAKLDRLISVVQASRKVQAGPTSFVLQSDNPVADVVGIQLEQLRSQIRGGLL